MESAFKLFFKGIHEFPKYKSKYRGKQSFHIPQSINIDFKKNKLSIPKFETPIDIVLHRKFIGQIKTSTISRTPTNKYFISVLVDNKKEIPFKKKINANTSIGIDLGIKDFIVTSNGEKINNPKYLSKSLTKLKSLQYSANKKELGSKNRTKANIKVALLYEKISNQRKDFLNKLSLKLISENQTICIEDLNVKKMLKKHSFALPISDASWSMFIDMLKYKAEWYGKNIIQIGQFDPSTKLCSNCGRINHTLTLKDREWKCNLCGASHDRDVNAAINVKEFALKKTATGSGKELVELPTLIGTMKQEVVILKNIQQSTRI
jgi:putative transposase